MIEKCDEHPDKGVLFCGGPIKEESKEETSKAKECDDGHQHDHDEMVENNLLKAIDAALEFVNTYTLNEHDDEHDDEYACID